MTDLINQLRQQRNIDIVLKNEKGGDLHLTARRPTDMEMAKFGDKMTLETIFKEFVIGWDFTEDDIVGNGSSVNAQFNSELFLAWIEDNPQHWDSIANAITSAYAKHQEKLLDAKKK